MGDKITVGLDIQREIKFNINAMVAMERRFDLPLPKVFDKERLGYGTIIAMLTIGLKAGGMKIGGTAEEQEDYVGALLQQHWIDQGRTLEEMMKFVTEAMNAAGLFNRPEEKEATANPAQDAGD